MSDLIPVYLSAAATAVDLLADPAVGAAWAAPSALAEFGVSGLAGHLASQLLQVVDRTAEPPADSEPIPLLQHYEGASWRQPNAAPVNARIRDAGEEIAAGGQDALVRHGRRALDTLRTRLPDLSPQQPVFLPQGPWALTLHDFLITRTMEIVVHCDDLAVSVGVPTPAQDPSVDQAVLDLLQALSARRHGTLALIRAFSRAERSPATLSAF